MPSPRPAGPADIPALAAALANAFADDPVFAYVLPPGPGRDARLRRFFELLLPVQLRHGRVLTSEGTEGGAIWDPPGAWRLPMAAQLRLAPSLVRLYGARSFSLLADYRRLEAVHAAQPPDHWYLSVLGTDPAHQGRGIGASLLEPVLRDCDEQGLGAYLESSKESNLAFYGRFGFEVIDEHPFHPGGPSVWPMWRAPR